MRILVVEDDPDIANLVRHVAAGEGHQVMVAARGSEAIQAALIEDFDLLICDFMLPDITGLEVILALKAQAPQLPVIVVSALDPNDIKDQLAEAGASCFLRKPVPIELLREEMRLVMLSRAGLKIIVVDPDPIHRVRLTKTLEPLGCEVLAFGEAAAAQKASQAFRPSLVMLDGAQSDALETVRWSHGAGIPVFVYAEPEVSAKEDAFMRAGASLFLNKPIDTDALLTQARFLAHV